MENKYYKITLNNIEYVGDTIDDLYEQWEEDYRYEMDAFRFESYNYNLDGFGSVYVENLHDVYEYIEKNAVLCEKEE